MIRHRLSPICWGKLLRLYLFFFYFSGITHFLLQITGSTIFVGFRQAVYMSLLWLIPVLLMPRYTKLIAALIGSVLWATSMVSLGYFCIYGQEFSQSVMFIMFESNPAESSEFIAQYFEWWMLAVFAGHSFIAWWLWHRIEPPALTMRQAAIGSLLILTFLFFFPMFKEGVIKQHPWSDVADKIQRRMEPAEPWQMVIGYLQYRKQLASMQELLEQNSKLPPLANLEVRDANLPATLVLVIGESTNRQHMSLYGYIRPTTPRLDALRDQLTVFEKAVAPRPFTIESLEQILTFADQENPDLALKKPSLMNMMRQAGYKTYWITNQQTISKRNTMLTNFSKQMDVQYYMNHSRAQNSREYDENVFAPFKEVLEDDAPRKFIVIHLLGTHMKYDYRYPPEFDRFRDRDGIAPSIPDNRVSVINAYDNAVLYNDFVISTLLETLMTRNDRSLMVYFADHGEDVYDTPPHDFVGRNEAKPTLAMYAVPFLMWMSPSWKESTGHDFSNLTQRPYSMAHFIHTWSDLVGITHDEFVPEKSIINPAFVPHPLWIGNPNNKASLRELQQ
ncbi:MAG TPA: phosphoethanolamine transferase CptA [Methylophilaceae bacterium]